MAASAGDCGGPSAATLGHVPNTPAPGTIAVVSADESEAAGDSSTEIFTGADEAGPVGIGRGALRCEEALLWPCVENSFMYY
jgi:hypothetical protein